MPQRHEAVAHLAAALNDPRRSRIGDPWSNTWPVSFVETEVHELNRLGRSLDALDVLFQTNYGRAELPDRPTRAFVSVYDVEDQRKLLDALAEQLEPRRREQLHNLVVAREPTPCDIVRRMVATIGLGKSHAYLANALNQQKIVAGMGGRRWTERKTRRVIRCYAGACERRHEAA